MIRIQYFIDFDEVIVLSLNVMSIFLFEAKYFRVSTLGSAC